MQTCWHEQIELLIFSIPHKYKIHPSKSSGFWGWFWCHLSRPMIRNQNEEVIQNRPWHRTCPTLYHCRLFYLLPAVFYRRQTWSWGGFTLEHDILPWLFSHIKSSPKQPVVSFRSSRFGVLCFFSECFQSLRLAKTWTDPLFNIRNPPSNILLLYQGLSIFWMPHTNSKKYIFCQA